ncbi:MucR family transcriptional regulator [Candidatus Gromoviella agglomerans]|uniref:MucR family transcriptional regulator n=1 Tax=Candidatus Gromoviella agglomerans TaxID=2806609 RepID=UPI001E4E3FFA|nr:MucR family transcriptional regulator [Candidatus Gromoviella agglomerans]UFX98236.1 MucR family transcriptional regulator [Candidatus Gromoviella agglomerans]
MSTVNSGVSKDDSIYSAVGNIVASYAAKNEMSSSELLDLINNVYNTLIFLPYKQVSSGFGQAPAVSIEDSITDDYLICLEDGKKLKMLKRHLKSSYNITPDEYRSRWGLPSDYPMVAPNYAKKRSVLAKKISLGTRKNYSGSQSRVA